MEVQLQTRGSVESLKLLARSECGAAGFHLPLGPLRSAVLPAYVRWLRRRPYHLLLVAERQQGLITQQSNPKRIDSLKDLTRRSVRFVNRQPDSGTRVILDGLLELEGIDPERIRGYRTEEFTHTAVAAMVAGCRRCPLCEGRTRTVPGEGDPAARLMLVGEGPGQKEDETGRPFVGAAGGLLDDILSAIEIPRAQVFIANVVKCRPPRNRTPLPEEQEACLPYLRRQIELVRPRVLLALGATAAAALLGTRKSLGELRGRVHHWRGIPLVATYHPAALLRNPNWKRPTWDDVRIARQLLDR